MFFHELLDLLNVLPVVDIGVGFESRSEEQLVPHAHVVGELDVLVVVVRESGQLASLPGVVAHVEPSVLGPSNFCLRCRFWHSDDGIVIIVSDLYSGIN